jgi:hypothetical protein
MKHCKPLGVVRSLKMNMVVYYYNIERTRMFGEYLVELWKLAKRS